MCAKRSKTSFVDDGTASDRFVIVVANLKGGVGKTTSSGYLARALVEAGKDVVGFDLDPELTWLKWSRVAELGYPVLPSSHALLGTDLKSQTGAPGEKLYVVVDTPPNDTKSTLTASLLADEVIVPLSPTDFDASRLSGALQPVAEAETALRRPLASVLLVKWNAQFKLAAQVKDAIDAIQAPLLESKVRNLTRYASFAVPTYLDEYNAVLKELGVL